VTFTTGEGPITVSRGDGRTATLAWPGRPDRMVALHRREQAELLAEELRRLDPDEVYAETLHHGHFPVTESPGSELPGTEFPGTASPADELRQR